MTLAEHATSLAGDGPRPAGLVLFAGADRRYAIGMSTVEEEVAGALLKSARLRLGLSQHAFAALLGVAQPTLSAYESGRRQPTLPTLLRLLRQAGLELRIQVADRDDH